MAEGEQNLSWDIKIRQRGPRNRHVIQTVTRSAMQTCLLVRGFAKASSESPDHLPNQIPEPSWTDSWQKDCFGRLSFS